MVLLRALLFPLTLVYSVLVRLRNHLYGIGYSRSISFEIPVIVVGNLSVGGTGKTPATEYLVRLLGQDGNHPGVLSRGYRRKSRGFRMVAAQDDATTVGDEPLQLYHKYSDLATVAVGEDRAEAIPKILFERPETNVIVMDDGFQHRSVSPSYSVLLSSYQNPFYKDYLMPTGTLREHRRESSRADCVIITKCPEDIGEEAMTTIAQNVERYSGRKPIFFSSLSYDEPVRVAGAGVDLQSSIPADFHKVILVTGIANPKPLQKFVESRWDVIAQKAYADHAEYNEGRLHQIRQLYETSAAEGDCVVLTTEKDAVKLTTPRAEGILSGVPIYALPIRMEFVKNGSDFDTTIRDHVTGMKRD